MATNLYFSPKVRSEQLMYEDIIIESIRMYGQDVYYLPREIVNRDYILGEDIESQFDDAYMIEAYIENTEGFEGEGNIFQKFGMEIRDECTFILAKRTWENNVGRWEYDRNDLRPFEGDLIYLPMSNSFFEISFVEHEQPFYQLNNLPVYRLNARLFEFGGEDFNTGVAEIDRLESTAAYTLGLKVYTNTADMFEIGTRVYQVTQRDGEGVATQWVSGKVVRAEYLANQTYTVYVADIESNDDQIHFFYVSDASPDTYIGNDYQSPSITGLVQEIYSIEQLDNDTFTADRQAMNAEFETAADAIIDFSEINPFGDPRDV